MLQTLKPGDALEGGMLVRAAQDNTYLANGFISTPIGDTAGLVDIVVGGAGTGGTLTGIARQLKPRRAGLRVVASGVMWPDDSDPFAATLAAASRHRPVWADIDLP